MATQQQEEAVRQWMLDLERRVRERRRLMGSGGDASAARDELRSVADNWYISAHLPVVWETPIVGRAAALTKRLMRRGLRWYINPIVDQQNDFNAAVARAFVHMAAQQDELARLLGELERRLATLEARADGSAGPGADRP